MKVIVLHLDRTREWLAEMCRRVEARRSRLHNPEKGSPARVVEASRLALKKLWGPPIYSDETAELYARPR